MKRTTGGGERKASRGILPPAGAAALLLGLVCSGSGCGTRSNAVSSGENGSGVPQLVIYGGVRTDAYEIANPGMIPGLSALLIFDVPLSIGLDTALLPFTVFREILFPPEPVAARDRTGIFGSGKHW